MNQEQLESFLCEALETERGGVQIYEAALECAENEDLKEEWQEYLEQTREHVEILENVCQQLGIDLEQETTGVQIVRATGEALLKNMQVARDSGDGTLAQIVAAEAVAHAELKDHLNWQLIGLVAKEAEKGDRVGELLQEAYDQVEEQEEEHVFHNQGWARELWAECLGIEAVLPPPEEKLGIKVPKKAESEVLKQRSKQIS
jgi:rubrerythrin